jgi:hypothetical protein
MNVSDEMLMAYLDDELDPPARARFEAACAEDAELANRVARQRAVRARLRSALDGTLDEPVPQRLIDSARKIPIPAPAIGKTAQKSRWSGQSWFAMAASLVLGVLIGQRVTEYVTPTAQIAAGASGPVAQGALDAALSRQLASEQDATSGVHVGLSFLAKSGEYCRTFFLRDAQATAGLACHAKNKQWRIRMLESTDASAVPAGTMRQAGSVMPESLRLAVEARIDGEPLDRAAEARARDADWENKP